MVSPTVDKEFARRVFDKSWYLRAYPDVAAAGVEPFGHFYRHGHNEGRHPGPWFDAEWYFTTFMEGAPASMSAFEHFATVGVRKGLAPHPGLVTDRLWLEVVSAPEPARAGKLIEVMPRIAEKFARGAVRHLPFAVPLDGHRWDRILRLAAAQAGRRAE